MTAKVLLIAEVQLGSSANARYAVDRMLDRFREAVLPSWEHNITLYQATAEDLIVFASAGKLLRSPEPVFAEH